MVGPLTEDSELVLICEVRGGEPRPMVSWFVNDKLVDGFVDTEGSSVVTNKLKVTRLRRAHLNTSYRCEATNTNLIPPTERTVRLEMNLRPESVEILEKPTSLIADQEYSLTCFAKGSRPQAELTWVKENRRFRRGNAKPWSNETVVSSTLVFMPAPEDNGYLLKCQALNPSIPLAPLQDSFLLNVVYSPLVSLQLGTSLKPHQIKEGDDVYFECNVRANPVQHKISWYHNSDLITQNMSTGVLFSTKSLVLQGVTRQNAGAYHCIAANTRGQTSSQPVNLRIQYSPFCVLTEPMIVGASLHEAVKVNCLVSADPADVTFTWQFNNSGESFQVPSYRYTSVNSTVSEFVYTPTSEKDYGTLACWATNSIGKQSEPCTFQLVPASKPSPLHNCTLRSTVNTTGDWLEVECMAGYDGGLTQTFYLEAVDTATSVSCLNTSSTDTPVFRLEVGSLMRGGTPSTTVQLVMYAANQKGRSEQVVLEDIAIRDAEKRTEWVSRSGSFAGSSMAVLLGVALLGFAVTLLTLTICLVRRRTSRLSRTSLAPAKQIEVTHGHDQRYVVAYQLKPEAKPKQPDILNRVTGDPYETDVPAVSYSGPGVTATFMSPCENASSLASSPTAPTTTDDSKHNVLNSQHLFSTSIPGPESCV
ncbi:nephrin-like isoform X2 [Rhodnius prolixus]